MDVVDIEIVFPTKEERARLRGPRSKRPQARIIAQGDGDASRTMYVPSQVARALAKDLPSLPIEYDQLRTLVFQLEDKHCFACCVDYLSRRDHSQSELSDKLKVLGFREESIASALERALAAHYLDDQRFMTQFIDERLRRGWGRARVEKELRRRGVDPHELPGYPEAFFNEADDLSRAREVLNRKSIPNTRPYEKLVRHLMSRGFSYSISSQVVKERLQTEG